MSEIRYRTYPSGKRYRLYSRQCEDCRESFETTDKAARYCSKQCYSEAQRTDLLGARNPAWKGGVIKNRGYRWLHRPEHPHAVRDYVPEHTLVMEYAIGRLLNADEVVHHRNGRKDDNCLNNLQLMTHAEHKRLHGRTITNAVKGRKGFQHVAN